MRYHSLLNSKLNAACLALESWYETNSQTTPASCFIFQALRDLEILKLSTKGSDRAKETDISIFLAGSLYAALNIPKHFTQEEPEFSSLKDSALGYWVDKLKIENSELEDDAYVIEKTREVITCLGIKVLAGESPFDIQELERLLPFKLHHHLNIIASYRDSAKKAMPCPTQEEFAKIVAHKEAELVTDDDLNAKPAERIRRAFQKAINACGTLNSAAKKNLVTKIKELKEKTLVAYAANKSGFMLHDCLYLANNVAKLAVKVGKNELNENDCQSFKFNTQVFQNSIWAAALLKSIAVIALAVVAGIGIGFGMAATTGALIGGLGFFAVTGAASAYKLKQNLNNNPLTDIENSFKTLAWYA